MRWMRRALSIEKGLRSQVLSLRKTHASLRQYRQRPLLLSLLSARQFRAAQFAASEGIFIAALLFIGFRDDGRDGQVAARGIHRYERQVRRADMLVAFGVIVLHPNLDADLHGSVVNAIHRRAEDDDVSNANRHEEIEMINGCRSHVLARVPMSSHGACHIDPVHEASAEESIERIGVVGENDLRHLRLRIAHWTRTGWVAV